MESLAEQSGNCFHLNRRGYLYLTGTLEGADAMQTAAQIPPGLGAGALRVHRGGTSGATYVPSPSDGFRHLPDGADLFLDPALIRERFPYLSEKVRAALHVRRAGWFSAQQLGAYLLNQARMHGMKLLEGRVCGVERQGGAVHSVQLADGRRIDTACLINAAGPYLKPVGRLLDIDLPVFTEVHLKVACHDSNKAVPRDAPLLIWNDPQVLSWTDEERQALAEEEASAWLTAEMPGGAHTRPEGGADSDIILLLWEYATRESEPVFPPPLDELYPEVSLRGMSAMLPGFSSYFERPPRPTLDGGYYTKTRENRPLIGALPVSGAYIIGALSGYGLMAACAAGELLAKHVTGSPLPSYAPAFSLERYDDPKYQLLLQNWGDSGQL
jgi:glycine/D-amino acid oxidase-like deaminating enzyme